MTWDWRKMASRKKRPVTGLKEEAIVVLRKRIRDQEATLHSHVQRVAQLENEEARLTRRAVSAEAEAEILMTAVRTLAYQVPNDTAKGKQARSDARKLLEKHKIQPPHSLGSSRKRKSRRNKNLILRTR